MRTKKIIGFALLFLVGVSTIGFSTTILNSGSDTSKQEMKPVKNLSQSLVASKHSPLPARAPEHVVFWQFFRHVLSLKEYASKSEAQGKNGSGFRSYYKNKIGLSDADNRELVRIALDCEREVRQYKPLASLKTDFRRSRFYSN